MSAALLATALRLALAATPGLLSSEALPAKEHRPHVVLAPREAPTATLRIVFPVGSYDDGDHPGLTRVAQHALIEAGRVRYEKLVTQLTAAGASLRLDTEVRRCGFTLTAPSDVFEPLARQVAELVFSPRLDEDAFPDAMRRALHDQADGTGGPWLYSMLASSVFADARFQNEPYGDHDSLDGVGPNAVRDHLREALVPGRAVVVLAGGIEPGRWRTFFDRFSGGQPRTTEHPALSLPQELNIRAGAEIHVLAYPAKLKGGKERAALALLSSVLDERTNEQLRAKGQGYSILVEPVYREWLDFLLVFAPLRSSVGSLGSLQEVVENLRKEHATPEEVERNRRHALHQLEAVDADSARLAEGLEDGWASPELATELATLSVEDFNAITAPWIAASNTIFIRFSPRLPSGHHGGRR